MEELKNHEIYKVLNERFPRIELDYVVLSIETYAGEETHRNAVVKALDIIGKRFDNEYSLISEKMATVPVDTDEFLTCPDDDYYSTKANKERSFSVSENIPYWYGFLGSPHGNHYLTKDFIEFNEILFPVRENITVYRWNNDFSDYFDAGKEWWGTGFWSVYDKTAGIIVVIGASTTD